MFAHLSIISRCSVSVSTAASLACMSCRMCMGSGQNDWRRCWLVLLWWSM